MVNTDLKKRIDKMFKSFAKVTEEAFFEVQLPKGYPGDNLKQDRIYSSILKKYIDTKTGEVINE